MKAAAVLYRCSRLAASASALLLPALGATGLAALLLLPTPAQAVFRCVQQGRVSFQEQACPSGAIESTVRLPGESASPAGTGSGTGTAGAPGATGSPVSEPSSWGAAGNPAPLPASASPASGIPQDASGAAAPRPAIDPAEQERLDIFQSERLRREAADTLRDLMARFGNQQAVCERHFNVTFSRSGDVQRSVNGATYPQNPLDPDSGAAAMRCIGRVNELQQQVANARAQCALRRCDQLP